MSVTVAIDGDGLDIHVGGLDRWWGLRSRIEIPLARVTGARVVPTGEATADRWLRTGGLGFPGLAAVGHFRGRDAKKQWWRVYRGERVLIIDLDDTSHFDRLVLEVDEPDSIADAINDAIGEEKTSDS